MGKLQFICECLICIFGRWWLSGTTVASWDVGGTLQLQMREGIRSALVRVATHTVPE